MSNEQDKTPPVEKTPEQQQKEEEMRKRIEEIRKRDPFIYR